MPSLLTPSVIARLISASLHAPMPFSLCDVMLRETDLPQGPGNSNPPLP